jgi:hypothetical protein
MDTSAVHALLVGAVIVLTVLSEGGLERRGFPNLLGSLALVVVVMATMVGVPIVLLGFLLGEKRGRDEDATSAAGGAEGA